MALTTWHQHDAGPGLWAMNANGVVGAAGVQSWGHCRVICWQHAIAYGEGGGGVRGQEKFVYLKLASNFRPL